MTEIKKDQLNIRASQSLNKFALYEIKDKELKEEFLRIIGAPMKNVKEKSIIFVQKYKDNPEKLNMLKKYLDERINEKSMAAEKIQKKAVWDPEQTKKFNELTDESLKLKIIKNELSKVLIKNLKVQSFCKDASKFTKEKNEQASMALTTRPASVDKADDLKISKLVKKYEFQRQDLLAIPAEDLFAIFCDFFDLMHAYNEINIPGFKASRKDFLDQLKKGGQTNMIEAIEKFINADPNKHSRYAEIVEERIKIISSAEFKNEINWIKENLNLKENPPYSGIFAIFLKENDFNKNKYLSAMKTAEFKKFYFSVKADYGISSNEVRNFLDVYLNPEEHARIDSGYNKKACAIIKKYFKEAEFDSLQCADYPGQAIPWRDREKLPAMVNGGRFENIIKEKSWLYGELKKTYDCKIKNSRDFYMFLDTENEALNNLLSASARGDYIYLKEKYPEKMRFNSISMFVEDFGNIQKKLSGQNISAREADEFLKLFHSDLGKLSGNYQIEFNFLDENDAQKIPSLLKDKNFSKYIDKIFEKYPALLSPNIDDQEKNIGDIVSSYYTGDKTEFFELNGLLEKISGFSAEKPEMKTANFDLKKQILEYILNNNLSKITLRSEQWSLFGNFDEKENLKICLDKIKDGSAQKLYEALSGKWKLREIELDEFLFLLAKNKEGFYFDAKNAEKFFKLEAKYNLLAYDSKTQRFRKISNLSDLVNSAELLAENFDTFNNDKVKEFVFNFSKEKLKDFSGGKGVWLTDFYFYEKNYEITNIDDTYKAINALRKNYGFNNEEIKEVFKRRSEDVEKIIKNCVDPKTSSEFNAHKEFYEKNKAENFGDIDISLISLLRAVRTKDEPKAIKAMEVLQSLGIDMLHEENFKYFLKLKLTREKVFEQLINPNFQEFYKNLIGYFYNNNATIDMLPEFSELYDKIINEKKDENFLFSEKYKDTISYLRTKFKVTNLEPSTLLPIMEIAENFDKKNIDELINELEKRGEKINGNDFYMLSKVLAEPELKEFLLNRQKMIAELEPILKIKPSPREKRDEGLGAPKKEKPYTERPPLEDLSSMFLFRLCQLKKGLENKDFLNSAAKIALSDRKDETTEYGGKVVMKNGANIEMRNIESYSEFDGAYYNAKYPYFNSGAFGFHYHSTTCYGDPKVYSGPSGRLHGTGGDIAFVNYADSTDMVVTTMKQGDKEVELNFDLYYVDKRNPGNPQAYIFDMGNRTIPIK